MRLDRLITIQQEVITRGDFKEEKITWQDLTQAWAEVQFAQGREQGVPTSGHNKQQQGIQPVHFIIRYRADLDKRMRIIWEGEVYEITAIQEIQRRHWIRITTEQRDNLES